MAALVIVTAPASFLADQLVSDQKTALMLLLPLQRETWTSLLCPSICPGQKLPRTKDEKLQRVSLLVKLVASQAHPAWGLQAQACLSSAALLPASLLTQMGAFVPPNTAGDPTQATCGLSSCSGLCLGPAGPLWPIQVAPTIFCSLIISISGLRLFMGLSFHLPSPPPKPACLPKLFSLFSIDSLPTPGIVFRPPPFGTFADLFGWQPSVAC